MKHKVAILGYGTIGKGVFKILKEKENFEIKYVFDYKENFNKDYLNLFTDDLDKVLNDDEVEFVVEVLGGFDFAYHAVKRAIESHKHVVTANKEVVALKINELTKLAKDNNVSFLFEASVGGGIPIINNLNELIKNSKVSKIYGILNGTTNFILTKIFEGLSFEEALKEAQELGFAEKDPSSDLEGLDMVRKIAILADIAWDTFVPVDIINHQSLCSITKENIEYAKQNHLKIKYACCAEKEGNTISLGVKPIYVSCCNILANINNEFNGILLKTDPNDELMFIGKGAGSLPTASAIVQDILAIIDYKRNYLYENRNSYEFKSEKISEKLETY